VYDIMMLSLHTELKDEVIRKATVVITVILLNKRRITNIAAIFEKIRPSTKE